MSSLHDVVDIRKTNEIAAAVRYVLMLMSSSNLTLPIVHDDVINHPIRVYFYY